MTDDDTKMIHGVELPSENAEEYHLKVFANRSELALNDGTATVFLEGANDVATKLRYKAITDALSRGFLKEQIRLCREQPEQLQLDRLNEVDLPILDALVDSMTSEVGRALVGLSVLQITVKAIEPKQSIRLHKGGSSSKNFGWRDGISMRTLDKDYITPVLRHEGLLKLNADGFMMTRTLAENYPYTKVYKAGVRGARGEWILLVDKLENGEMQALPALHYLLARLLNHAAKFHALAEDALINLSKVIAIGNLDDVQSATSFIRRHMATSSYAARIMEIAMHAFMQALQESGALGSATLVPLSQMRSANKKHGNIGDIEVREGGTIIEAWDAKYGKSYLRDELEELSDKLEPHESVATVGFVTSDEPELLPEVEERITELKELNGIEIEILSFEDWIARQLSRAVSDYGLLEADITRRWFSAYVESIAQKPSRQAIAPIDEPCFQWLSAINTLMAQALVSHSVEAMP